MNLYALLFYNVCSLSFRLHRLNKTSKHVTSEKVSLLNYFNGIFKDLLQLVLVFFKEKKSAFAQI